MNQRNEFDEGEIERVPRARGDEPVQQLAFALDLLRSPRPRG